MRLPRIGISLGDPGGIGPEIVARSLIENPPLPQAKYIIFGDRGVLGEAGRLLGISLNFPNYEGKDPDRPGIFVNEVQAPFSVMKKGIASGQNGVASFKFFEAAVRAARQGEIQALVTAPISKRSWELGGISWRGHTEYLSQFYPEAIMTFWSERLTVALLSHHVPLREAIRRVDKKSLLRFFEILRQSLEAVRPGSYEFLVAGLNPHAGEEGMLGTEEAEEIRPAIEEARSHGFLVSGPYPPDVIFRKAVGLPGKIVVALYHDQGLIAFKLEAFETGVNVTLGMPFIRTSPDHGTAFDIVGKGQASFRSMTEAIRLAAELSPDPL